MPRAPDELFKEFHTSLKRGPSGHALGACYTDLISFIKDTEANSVLRSLCILGGSKFCEVIGYFLDNPQILLARAATYLLSINKYPKKVKTELELEQFYEFASPRLRRLSSIADKNGKTRIIALFDYWSQTTLRPLHDYIMHLLTFFPDDCTYEQGDKLATYSQIQKGKYWCFDLKSATDRFPLDYQVMVLKKLIGSERADAWRSIMVDLPFESPIDKEPIKYSVGQPLGAYSSWAVFTLSHHVLLHYCGNRCGVPAKGQYVILGDDIVIFSRKIARTYVSILKILGVEVNTTKSLISYTLCEFAKRYWYKGVEVSPLPMSGFIKSLRRVYLLIPFIESLVKINWITQEEVSLRMVTIVKSVLRSLGLRRLSRFTRKANIFLISRSVLKGKISESDGLHAITDLVSLPNLSCNNKTSYFGLVRLRENFKKMNTCSAKRSLAVQMVEAPSPLGVDPTGLPFQALKELDDFKAWMLPGLTSTGKVVDFMGIFGGLYFTNVPHCAIIRREATSDALWTKYLCDINSGAKRVSIDSLPDIRFNEVDLMSKQIPDELQEEANQKEIQTIGYKVISLIIRTMKVQHFHETNLLESSKYGNDPFFANHRVGIHV